MSTNKLPTGKETDKKGFLASLSLIITKIINRTTAMFTVITLLICLFGVLQNQNITIDCRNCDSVAGEFPGGMLNSSVVMWFAVFSLLVAVISMISDFMKKKNVNHVITMCVHFVLSYIAFFFIFIRGQLFTLYSDSILFTGNGSWITGFALTIFFIGAYLIIFGTKFLWYILADRRKNKAKEIEAVDLETEE